MSEEKSMVIRPQDFIRSPYIPCPHCGAADAFGVVFISHRAYTRRCKQCLRSHHFELPRLEKKVIYVDQFAISDMVKAMNPESKANREGRIDPLWKELFGILDRLRRLQLIACPDSEFHERESAVSASPDRGSLKGMYRLLSSELRFRDHIRIESAQLHQQVTKWVSGEDATRVTLDRRDVLSGDLSDWTDVFMISMRLGDPEAYVDALRSSREGGHAHLTRVFDEWRAEARSFEDYFRAESRRWAVSILDDYGDYMERYAQYMMGNGTFTLDLAFLADAVHHVRVIKHALEMARVPDEEILPKLFEYIRSGIVEWLPCSRIAAALWATLATQAKTRSKAPGTGMLSDVQMISTLLPYCDAMLIDRECHGLLKNIPAAYRPDYSCHVFTASTRDELLEYLHGIERAASAEHLARVREVYGDRVDQATSVIPRID